MRKKGFYWVQYSSGNWTICEWCNGYWNHKGCAYMDSGFQKIDERQITRNETEEHNISTKRSGSF